MAGGDFLEIMHISSPLLSSALVCSRLLSSPPRDAEGRGPQHVDTPMPFVLPSRPPSQLPSTFYLLSSVGIGHACRPQRAYPLWQLLAWLCLRSPCTSIMRLAVGASHPPSVRCCWVLVRSTSLLLSTGQATPQCRTMRHAPDDPRPPRSALAPAPRRPGASSRVVFVREANTRQAKSTHGRPRRSVGGRRPDVATSQLQHNHITTTRAARNSHIATTPQPHKPPHRNQTHNFTRHLHQGTTPLCTRLPGPTPRDKGHVFRQNFSCGNFVLRKTTWSSLQPHPRQ